MNTQLILALLFFLIKTGHLYKLFNKCPNQKHCKCDFELKILKCQCNSKDCLINEFQNETYATFNEIQFKNYERIRSNHFNGSQLSKEIRLKFYKPSIIESFAFNSTEIKHLEIVYSDLKSIELGAFKNMKCEFLSLISMGKNADFNLDNFDSDTFIKALSIDYNFISSQFKRPFFINESTNFTLDELESYWTSKATIKNLFIKDIRGIEVLDSSWAPKFESLDRIEIVRTDIRIISRFFSRLHSKNLKYLTISKSRLETIESNVFEDLKNLRMLDLSYNSIKFIEQEAFYGLRSLKVLKLKSISTNNFIEDLDVCMLSFLPCNINVYLDDYDGSLFSCALIYLNEIKYDKSLDYIDLLKSLTIEELNYKRDNECKLKETLLNCFNSTNNTNNKCSYKSFKFENIDNTEVQETLTSDQDEIFALVELTLNKSTQISSTPSYKSTTTDDLYALVEVILEKTDPQQVENKTNFVTEFKTATSSTTTSTLTTSNHTNSTSTTISTSISTTAILNSTANIFNNTFINTTSFMNLSITDSIINITTSSYINLTTTIPYETDRAHFYLNKTHKANLFNEINNTNLTNSKISTSTLEIKYNTKLIETSDTTQPNQVQNQTQSEQNVFVFSQSSTSNQSYNNLLVVFKISISLLIFLLFLMSIANLYLLYSNRLTKGYNSNQVNIVNNANEDKSISLRSFGFRKSSIFFMRENSVGTAD